MKLFSYLFQRKVRRVITRGFLTAVIMTSTVGTMVMPALLYPIPVDAEVPFYLAAPGTPLDQIDPSTIPPGAGQPVSDSLLQSLILSFSSLFSATDAKNDAQDAAELTLKNTVFIALKQGMNDLLNTIAYDTATWLASGGEGQQPMFYTEGWGDYLTNLADGAAGDFLQKVGEDWADFNVCDPSDLRIKLSVGLGLAEIRRPRAPECRITQMVNNWGELINDENFLDRFTASFDPTKNDIGIAVTMFGKYFDSQEKAREAATNDRKEGGGFKAVVENITGAIKTPAALVDAKGRHLSTDSIQPEWLKVQYGDIVLDAVSTFTNTLAGKLFERLFKEGLAALHSDGSSDSDDQRRLDLSFLADLFVRNDSDLYGGDTGLQAYSGERAARIRFLDLLSAGGSNAKPYDLLTQLSTCSNATNPGPEECVITSKWRQALEKELTLDQAIRQGYVDRNAPFGAKTYSKDAIQKGIPYRSILILRGHSIVPVGWELAAEAIEKYYAGKPGGFTLGQIMDDFENKNSVFYGLVDPQWVLKVPDHLCRAQGFGEQLLYDRLTDGVDSNRDGDYNDTGDTAPTRQVGRAEYCADYQSCIRENPDGSCQNYGYCVEENRTWDLMGRSCPATFNTCQTFQAATGGSISYLQNTLDYGNCSADNAGCQWYCREYNGINDQFTCVPQGERVLRACAQPGGCPVGITCDVAAGTTTCTVPNATDNTAAVNLTINEACGSGSQWWNETLGRCVVNANCTIEQGGVSCATNSCDALSNLLFNGSFEATAANVPLPSGWIAGTANATEYFRSAVRGGGDQVYAGQRSLRFFSYGSNLPTGIQTVRSNALNLANGTAYTLSAKVYNRLSAGATVTIRIGSATPRQVPISTGWQTVSLDFTGGSSQAVELSVSGGQVAGSVWFDDIRITQACITNPVQLTLIGTADQDQSKIHFDRDVKTCSGDDAGCTQLISLKPDTGANIVPNGSFETWSTDVAKRGWIGNVTQSLAADAPIGSSVLEVSANDTATTQALGMLPSTSYFVSFWVKADTEISNGVGLYLDYYDGSQRSRALDLDGDQTLDVTPTWRLYTLDVTTPEAGTNFALAIRSLTANKIYLDGVQIEAHGRNGGVSVYKEYGSSAGLTYLQKAPDSLNCTGNPSTDPAACAGYAPLCEPEEVGCESYTPVAGGASVPGVVAYNDYCPVECVGYDAYKQSSTFFETQEPLEYFIPSTATQCNAAQVGCDEFTNLDAVAAGGEGKEYYSYVRLCQKPTDGGATCQNFYTWQGSDETGFQLKVYTLSAVNGAPKEAIADADRWPAAWGDRSMCDSREDLDTNPFCKEFYATDGSIYYRIYDNTITCSEDCHPYRKTRLGESDAIAQLNCEQSNGSWDANLAQCIYQVIPGEGQSCAPAAAGCREYRGNTGGNVAVVYQQDFETVSDWMFGSQSATALSVGGHSLRSTVATDGSQVVSTMAAVLPNSQSCSSSLPSCSATVTANCYDATINRCVIQAAGVQGVCYADVGQTNCSLVHSVMRSSETYLLSFWAKAEGSAIVQDAQVVLGDLGGANRQTIHTFDIRPEWNYYVVGPFTYPVNPKTILSIIRSGSGSAAFYIDNVQVQEVTDYAYVVKGSWNTPVSCDTNPFVSPAQPAPQYMLSCKQYRDGEGAIHNLKSFNHLCRESAVGCEAFIDTQNSASPFAQNFNESDPLSDVKVPADSIIYLVDQPQFRCDSAVKGCEAVGLPRINADGTLAAYQTTYVVNDPDQYATTLCANADVGCEEYKTSSGSSFFKNPGARTCEYKLIPGQQSRYGWFKIGSTATTPDCPVAQPPVGEIHPSSGFAGLCSAQYSSCTAFIDPVSTPAKNLVANYDFTQNIDGNAVPDSWNGATAGLLSQSFDIQAGTLYTLAFTTKDALAIPTTVQFELSCPNVSSYDNSLVKDPNNGLIWRIPSIYGAQDTRAVLSQVKERSYSGRFMITRNANCTIRVVGDTTTILQQVKSVELKKTEMSYALNSTVDKLSCNGVIDPENGCVAFNDRSMINYKVGENDVTTLAFDADVSGPGTNNGLGVTDCAGNCDSNAVLKVKADRECGAWLSCTSEAVVADSKGTEKKYCLDIGLCNSLDAGGNCNNFITTTLDDQDYTTNVQDIANVSGYARAGLYFSPAVTGDPFIRGYVPYNAMEQRGGAALIANGDFERRVGDTSEPVGWAPNNSATSDAEGWRDYKFQAVADGRKSVQGGNYLRLNGPYEAFSEGIDVEPNQEYILGLWINTEQLRDTSAAALPNARVCYSQNDGPFECPIQIEAGLGWQYKTVSLPLAQSTRSVKIRLDNTNGNDGDCKDAPGNNTSCGLGGYTLFDDVGLNPVLVTKTTPLDNFESRSCRIYPAADALSCRYEKGDTTYYGQYGYCLTQDPANPSQCLQWWPVDQIKGEVLEQQNGYTDRAPLYYCVEKKKTLVEFAEHSVITTASGSLPEEFNFIPDQGGGEIHFVKFKVDPDYAPMFRWPYLQKMTFKGHAGGYGNDDGVYVTLPFSADLYKDGFDFYLIDFTAFAGLGDILSAVTGWEKAGIGKICYRNPNVRDDDPRNNGCWIVIKQFNEPKDSWGGFGVIPLPFVVGGNINVVASFPTTWTFIRGLSNLGAMLGPLANFADDLERPITVVSNSAGVKVITDQDPEFDNVFTDPIPDIDGDVLGFAWYLKESGTQATVFTGSFQGGFEVEYCSKLVQVVTSSGANKAWSNRVNPGSGYVQAEQVDRWLDGSPEEVKYIYERPFDYDAFLANPTTYQSSDYRPFGSIVQPTSAQYPNVWDSRTSSYKQPLFYEPPRTSFGQPYQPRMGELHSFDINGNPGLKRLFLKTYSVWEWQLGTNADSRVDDHYYEIGGGWDIITEWGATGGYCNTTDLNPTTGARLDNAVCRIVPRIENVELNDNDTAVQSFVKNGMLKLSFTPIVDSDQLPIRSYVIDWGDGEQTAVSGAALLDRPNPENPFVLYHSYDYWKMRRAVGVPACNDTQEQCTGSITIRLKDNWNAEVTRTLSNVINVRLQQ